MANADALAHRRKTSAGSVASLVTGRTTAAPEEVALVAADAATLEDVAASQGKSTQDFVIINTILTIETAGQLSEAEDAVAAEDHSTMADRRSCVKADASSAETRDTSGETALRAEGADLPTDSEVTEEKTEATEEVAVADTHLLPKVPEADRDLTIATDAVAVVVAAALPADAETTLLRVLPLAAESTRAPNRPVAASETVAEPHPATTELSSIER